jgi:hypothetical protein
MQMVAFMREQPRYEFIENEKKKKTNPASSILIDMQIGRYLIKLLCLMAAINLQTSRLEARAPNPIVLIASVASSSGSKDHNRTFGPAIFFNDVDDIKTTIKRRL